MLPQSCTSHHQCMLALKITHHSSHSHYSSAHPPACTVCNTEHELLLPASTPHVISCCIPATCPDEIDFGVPWLQHAAPTLQFAERLLSRLNKVSDSDSDRYRLLSACVDFITAFTDRVAFHSQPRFYASGVRHPLPSPPPILAPIPLASSPSHPSAPPPPPQTWCCACC